MGGTSKAGAARIRAVNLAGGVNVQALATPSLSLPQLQLLLLVSPRQRTMVMRLSSTRGARPFAPAKVARTNIQIARIHNAERSLMGDVSGPELLAISLAAAACAAAPLMQLLASEQPLSTGSETRVVCAV